ncbi:MAG: ArsR family transcriptional regulator [Verrucomicrobia bacterium]|nr:ArsR family transcriptional regulator [Verrucomicrobiota bacterium]
MATKKKSASTRHTKSVSKAKGIGKAIHLLASEGKSYRQISSELGVSKGTISYHLGDNQKDKTIGRTRHYRSQIDAYLQKEKAAVKNCPDCGEEKQWFQMDFDHVRGVKKFSLSQYHRHTQSLKVVQAEVAKCDIVCACCHRLRTYMRALEAKIARENKVD